jgi:glycosyltransferase involved in cell wall biosynthesis
MVDISVVIPLFNEEESLPELFDWIARTMQQHNFSYEVIFIDDGSKDKSWEVIENIIAQNTHAKGIKFQRNYGKSAALNTGFEICAGNVVITMDADLQDSPDEIPDLYKMIMTDGFDLVSGWKKKRFDPISKTIPTKLFNWATRKMSGIELNDFNCGLKAYKNKVVKSIEVFGEMHRYIPVIAKWAGFTKITEKEVQHRERKYGTTKFGLERFINGFLDLFTITFVSKFGKRPMHFFGAIGTLFMFIGVFSAMYLIGEKIYIITVENIKPRDVTQMPAFYLALTSIIIGVQLFLAGFIGELVSRNSSYRNSYLIEKKIG